MGAGWATWAIVVFTPEREQHDSRNHRQVQVQVTDHARAPPVPRPLLRPASASAMIATQSKYDHHSAAATVIPSRAATIRAGIEWEPGGADPDRDHRLAQER